MSRPEFRAFDQQAAPLGPQVAPFVLRYLDRWRPYDAAWSGEDGSVWIGALALAQATGLRLFSDFVYREVSSRIDGSGRIAGYDPDAFDIDQVNPARVLLALAHEGAEPRFDQALQMPLDQLARHPRTASGNYWHTRIHPNQVRLDGLYMAQPFRCAWAHAAGQAGTVDDVLAQFGTVWQHLRHGDSGLFVHGWDERRTEPWADPDSGRSANVWGRAMGCYVMALVDCIEALSGFASAQTVARVLTTALRSGVDALLAVRTPEGLWLQLPALPRVPGNYPEASASLMIAYALMKGGRLGLLEAGAAAAGERALAACIDTFLDAHQLGGSCADAGLGSTPCRDGSIASYLAEPTVANHAKGVAALLLAVSEALRR